MLNKISKRNKILILVLIAILVKELVFVMVIPPWQTHDEPTHFAYTQYLVEEKRLPIYQGEFVRDELSFSQEYAESEILTGSTRIMEGRSSQYRLIHQDFNEINNQDIFNNLSGLSRQPLLYTQAPEEYRELYYTLPADNEYKNAAAIYQPLYYLLEAIPYGIFYDQNIMVRLYAMRVFSVLIYLATIFVCYLIAIRLTKKFSFSIAFICIIGLQPVYSHLAAGLNNDTLLIFLATLTIYWCLRIIQKISLYRIVWLGIILSLGMLTKPQFAVFPLLALIPFGYHYLKKTIPRPTIIKYLLLCVLIGVIISGWWYVWSYTQYDSLFLSSSNQLTQDVSLSIKDAISHYLYRWMYGAVSFSFIFGSASEMTLPAPAAGIGAAVMLIGFIGLIRLAVKKKWQNLSNQHKAAGWLLIGSFVLTEVILLYIFSEKLFLTGQARFPADGRYYFPAMASLTFIWLIGFMSIIPKSFHKWAYSALIIGAALINSAALFYLLLPSYYL